MLLLHLVQHGLSALLELLPLAHVLIVRCEFVTIRQPGCICLS